MTDLAGVCEDSGACTARPPPSQPVLQCQVCQLELGGIEQLQRHSTANDHWFCQTCSAIFATKKLLYGHCQKTECSPHICFECGGPCTSFVDYKRHLAREHPRVVDEAVKPAVDEAVKPGINLPTLLTESTSGGMDGDWEDEVAPHEIGDRTRRTRPLRISLPGSGGVPEIDCSPVAEGLPAIPSGPESGDSDLGEHEIFAAVEEDWLRMHDDLSITSESMSSDSGCRSGPPSLPHSIVDRLSSRESLFELSESHSHAGSKSLSSHHILSETEEEHLMPSIQELVEQSTDPGDRLAVDFIEPFARVCAAVFTYFWVLFLDFAKLVGCILDPDEFPPSARPPQIPRTGAEFS